MVKARIHVLNALWLIVCFSFTAVSFRTSSKHLLLGGYHVLSVTSRSELETMNRSELQKIAKERGVRANMKSSEIISELLLKNPISVPDTNMQHTTMESDLGLRRSAQRVLFEQGIEIRDLLDLRQSAMKIQQNFPTPSQHINKKSNLTSSTSDTNGIKNSKILKPSGKIKLKEGKNHESSPSNDISNGIFNDETFNSINKHSSNPAEKEPVHSWSSYTSNKVVVSTQGKENEKARLALLENVTLKDILVALLTPSEEEGFKVLYKTTHIRCFAAEKRPSLSSALHLLRKTEMAWARRKVEDLYLTKKLSNPPQE